MPRFYEHNVEQSRNRRSLQRKQSERAVEIRGEGDVAVEFAIRELQFVAMHGLPDCYGSFTDFLFDFYPDLSWSLRKSQAQIEQILADDRIQFVATRIKEDWAFDMIEELSDAAAR